MKKSIFEYEDYKKYLDNLITARVGGGRGVKAQLAALLGCQAAYISQIFNGAAHVSLEQADVLNGFFAHTQAEADHFFIMVNLARAGSSGLRDYFKGKLKASSSRNMSVKRRMQIEGKTLDLEGQMIYYSQWYYAAVHQLVAIPLYQTKDAIAQYLGFPELKIGEVLSFLTSTGLITHEMGRYKVGKTRLFIDRNSPHIVKHHANWRVKALSSLENPLAQDFHFSASITLSKDDAAKLRKRIGDFLEELSNTVEGSRDECLRALCIDFYKV